MPGALFFARDISASNIRRVIKKRLRGISLDGLLQRRSEPVNTIHFASKVFFHGEAESRGSLVVKESVNAGNRKFDKFDYAWVAGGRRAAQCL